MTPVRGRDFGYSAPALGSVYGLATPDSEPLPEPTRTATLWQGRGWIEIDPATGAVVARGEVRQ